MWGDCGLPSVGMGIFNEIEIMQFLSYWSFSTALQLLMVLKFFSPPTKAQGIRLYTWYKRSHLFTKGLGQSEGQGHNRHSGRVYQWQTWCLTLWRRKATLLQIKWSTMQYLNALHWTCKEDWWGIWLAEIGSYHGLITHKAVRGWSRSANLAKLHQPSAICKPMQMLWQPM